MINGKFKKNLLNKFKNETFLEILDNLNFIPLKKFITIIQGQSKKFKELQKSMEILDFLNEHLEIVKQNINIFSQYLKLVQCLNLFFKLNMLLRKKEFLLKELELSKKHRKSSDMAAISDLLKKLDESLNKNRKKLKYLEEDYFQRKNQIDQIKKTINDDESRVLELTKQKKECFGQINKITRGMEDVSDKLKGDSSHNPELNESLSNAEKIKVLQKKAKEIQFEINQINLKISKTKLKLEEFYPHYDVYKEDYENILEIIKIDEQKIINLQSELKEKIKHLEDVSIQELDEIDLRSLRPIAEIEEDMQKNELELSEILIPDSFFNSQNPNDLSPFIKKFNEINEMLKYDINKAIIDASEKEIAESFQYFQKMEIILDDFEMLINKFLLEINLKSHFEITITNDNKRFLIHLIFIRNDKEQISFEELTTPEKIFFIIVFFISIQLKTETENIIFSNLALPSKYNKAGSIFRTIRKILPIFEIEKDLSRFNLIFIIANLDMKKEIKKLKIITI